MRKYSREPHSPPELVWTNQFRSISHTNFCLTIQLLQDFPHPTAGSSDSPRIHRLRLRIEVAGKGKNRRLVWDLDPWVCPMSFTVGFPNFSRGFSCRIQDLSMLVPPWPPSIEGSPWNASFNLTFSWDVENRECENAAQPSWTSSPR